MLRGTERILHGQTVPLERDSPEPPMLAEFLLTMLLKPSRVDGVTGDLRERFDSDLHRFGHRRAVWWYWRRTIESLWPLMRLAIGKALKWGVVAAAVKRMFDHSAG
jgi:hypothetical protein